MLFILEGQSKLKEGFSEKCQMICSIAISKLEEVYRQLEEADIRVADLKKIEENYKQMELLCKSGTTQQDKSVKRSAGVLSGDMMLSILQKRMKEYQMLQHHQGLLLSLCQSISQIRGTVCLYLCYLQSHLVLNEHIVWYCTYF